MTSQLEKPRITEINVRIDCNGCVQKVKKALNGIKGIDDLYINLPQQKLIVIGRADPGKIIKAIKKVRKVATICSHREAPEPDSQPTDTQPEAQPPEEGAPLESGNAPPAEDLNPKPEPTGPPPQPPPDDQPPQHLPPENQPNDQPPPPQQTSENPPPSTVDTRPNQPENRFTPRDAGESQVIYQNPPDCGYRHSNGGYARGYSPSYREHLQSHPEPSFGHERPAQPSFQKSQYPVYHERPRRVYHEPPSRLVYQAAASQPVYYEPPKSPVPCEPPRERVYYEPSHPPVNHEPPQPPVSHEIRQTQVYHEPPQTRVYHEPPQTRVYHEPPPPIRVYHEPLHTPIIHEPPQQYVRNEPPTQPPVHATHSYNRYRRSPHITEYEYVRSPPRHTRYSRMDYYDMDPYTDPYPQGGASNGYAGSVFSEENPNACTIV